MSKIYIGFSYPKEFKIGAAGIAMWMNRPYSHVYVRFENNKIPSTVYHAAHGMVHFREFENFKLENNIVKEYCIEISEETRKKLLIECVCLAGEKYGYSELCKIFTSDIIFACTKKTVIFNNGKGYICSELVGKLCVNDLGMTFTKPLHLLKPSDIDEGLEKTPSSLNVKSTTPMI